MLAKYETYLYWLNDGMPLKMKWYCVKFLLDGCFIYFSLHEASEKFEQKQFVMWQSLFPTILRISLLSTHTDCNAVSVLVHTDAVAYFQLGWWLHSRLMKTKHCCYGTNPGFSSWLTLKITHQICNFQDNFGFGFVSDGTPLDYAVWPWHCFKHYLNTSSYTGLNEFILNSFGLVAMWK